MKMLIKNGRLLDPSQGLDGLFDILIDKGKVADILPQGKFPDKKVDTLDVEGLLVVPGIIDMHTHLRDPGYEYKEDIESGTMAAAAGGVTSLACMANTSPVNDNASVTEDIVNKAKRCAAVKVYPIGAMTKGLKGQTLAEIASMKKAGIVAVSDDGMPVKNPEVMRKGLEYCLGLDMPLISHAEDPDLSHAGVMNEGELSMVMGLKGIPNAAEDIMVMRDIALAELTGARIHIAHISTEGALCAVRDAKKRGVRVTAEAAPHHFILTEDAVEGYNTNAKMNPPLRNKKDVEAVISGLADGTIDVIATDHAPHSSVEKDVEFDCAANGIIGLETMIPLSLMLVNNGKISLADLIEKMTLKPAEILGIKGGTLKKGVPADITIIDTEKEYIYDVQKSRSKSKNTPFDGWKMKGKVKFTIVDGKVVYEGGRDE